MKREKEEEEKPKLREKLNWAYNQFFSGTLCLFLFPLPCEWIHDILKQKKRMMLMTTMIILCEDILFSCIIKYDGGTAKSTKYFETRYLAEKFLFKSSYLTILSAYTTTTHTRMCLFFRKWKCSYQAMHMVHFLFWTVFQFKSSLFIPVMMIAIRIPLQQTVYIYILCCLHYKNAAFVVV